MTALNERISIERAVLQPDNGGGSVVQWQSILDCWAAVRAVAGKEAVEADRQAGLTRYRVTVRRPAVAITADDRVVWESNGGLIMNIREVHDNGMRAGYLLIVAERGGVG